MAKIKKIIVAGPLVVEAIYPAPNPRDSDGVRAGKRSLSSEAQQKMNLKYAYQKLELIIAANFAPGDLIVTFTYDDAHLPDSREEAQTRMQAFWRKLRAAYKERGRELKYLYGYESRHGEGRWHHHTIVTGTGDDYQLIRELWGNGLVDFKPFRVDRDKNYATLAHYYCKEQRDKLGQRLWSGSKNLTYPKPETFRVPNDTPLEPPEGATILDDTGNVVTAYGHYRYLKYLAKGWVEVPKKRARRRRKRSG